MKSFNYQTNATVVPQEFVDQARILSKRRRERIRANFDFHDALDDGWLEAGIESFVTLFHRDLPQVLYEDAGGWLRRGTFWEVSPGSLYSQVWSW